MKFLTWNIRHGGSLKRKDEIIENTHRHDCDVVVLTEYRDDKGEFLKTALKDRGWTYQIISYQKSRDNSLLIASKRPIEVSSANRPPPQAGHRWLESRLLNMDLTLLGVHIPGANDKWDKKQFWEAVVQFAKQNVNSEALIIGDFNTGLGEDAEGTPFKFPEYMTKLREMGWTDAWRSLHPGIKEYTWYSNKHKGFRLDYAFLSPLMKSKLVDAYHSQAEREDKTSDHASLVVELDL